MTRRHVIAVAVAMLVMVTALAQPLWIRATGSEVTVELLPVDPLSLFRGNYVDLGYKVPIEAWPGLDGERVFVVFERDARPSRAVRVTTDRPELAEGESCIAGRVGGSGRVGFPTLEQFFVTPEDGQLLERDLSRMVGVIRTTASCRSTLVAIEAE